MKQIVSIIVLVVLFCAGCSKNSKQEATTTSQANESTMPVHGPSEKMNSTKSQSNTEFTAKVQRLWIDSADTVMDVPTLVERTKALLQEGISQKHLLNFHNNEEKLARLGVRVLLLSSGGVAENSDLILSLANTYAHTVSPSFLEVAGALLVSLDANQTLGVDLTEDSALTMERGKAAGALVLARSSDEESIALLADCSEHLESVVCDEAMTFGGEL